MPSDPDDIPGLERILGHPVDVALRPLAEGGPVVAVSRTGDPVRIRAAWVGSTGDVLARVGCPPGIPSAVRPIIAAIVDVSADGVSDHLLLGRVARGIAGVRVTIADPDPIDLPVHASGILAARVPRIPHLIALDALTANGESVGRLMRTGLSEMSMVAGRMEGRLGSGHGMAAGFGAGDTVADLPTAEMEAGYGARLPQWLPHGVDLTSIRVEPEAAYPFAPPRIVLAWTTADDTARVLLRQCPGPLAIPETPDARGRAVMIGDAHGVMRARDMAFLVWEADERGFGIQVWGTRDPEADALRIATSIPVTAPGIP
ncbi:MAG: hypothetical protein EXQ74_04235 [Thermoleophilia bacterium]|nr:hypothetical protein [Thermoleophilia bacterium]